MPIAAERCGLAVGASSAETTKRKLMAYAAGIGAERDAYLNDVRDGGIVAPPAFVVTLEWPILNGPAYRQALGADQDTMQASVHVQQDTRFHRPIRPGDRLDTEGRIVAVRPTRAGAFVGLHIVTKDAASGDAVAETHTAAIFLRVPVEGAERSVLEFPPLRPNREIVGDADYSAVVPIARTLAHVYTECAAIWNPIHSEIAEAWKANLPDIILQGTCTWALAAERLIEHYGGGDPTRLKRFGGRFHGMVIPGGEIRVNARREEADGTIAFEVENDAGDLAIHSGIAEFA